MHIVTNTNIETIPQNNEPQVSSALQVDDFPTSHDGAFNYPGRTPEFSYTTDGENVLETMFVSDSVESGERKIRYNVYDPESGTYVDLDSYLRRIGVETLEDRVPVIAYGANRNPGSLSKKFNFGEEGDPRLSVVPVIKATRKGSDVVWSKNVGARGRQFADMVTNEDVEETEIGIFVSFLTHDQLALMHASEKQYDIIEQGTVVLEGGMEIPGLYYSGVEGAAYQTDDGKPVSVSNIPGKNRVGSEHTARSSLGTILDHINDSKNTEELLPTSPTNPDKFLEYYEALDKEQQATFRRVLSKFLDDNGLKYVHRRPEDARIHEWSTDSLPRLKDILNGFDQTGIQGRLFTNDLIRDPDKRRLVDEVINRSVASI